MFEFKNISNFLKGPLYTTKGLFLLYHIPNSMTKKSKNKILTYRQLENYGSAVEKVSAFKNTYMMMFCCMPHNWPELLYHKW